MSRDPVQSIAWILCASEGSVNGAALGGKASRLKVALLRLGKLLFSSVSMVTSDHSTGGPRPIPLPQCSGHTAISNAMALYAGVSSERTCGWDEPLLRLRVFARSYRVLTCSGGAQMSAALLLFMPPSAR